MDILLIEDNLTITKALTYTFETNGLTVKTVNNLTDAYDLTLAHYKLILLDVSLPDGSGFDFYKDMLFNKNIPTIFLTAKSLEDDVVKGLNLGAVDYITKPFSTRVLLAKINKYIKKENVVKVKNITFDFDKMEVYNDGNLVNLTSLEIKILGLLFKSINKVVTMRCIIINYIWDITGNDVNDNTLTVYLKRIREKLGVDLIKTVKGVGYRIDE